MTNLTAQGAPDTEAFEISPSKDGTGLVIRYDGTSIFTWNGPDAPMATAMLHDFAAAILADRQARQAAPEAPREAGRTAPVVEPVAGEFGDRNRPMNDDELQDFCISLSFDQDDYTVDVIRNVERRMLGEPLFQCSVESFGATHAPSSAVAANPDVAKMVGYMSPEQVSLVRDADGEAGTYIPLRATAAGKFTLPIFALAASEAEAVKPSPIPFAGYAPKFCPGSNPDNPQEWTGEAEAVKVEATPVPFEYAHPREVVNSFYAGEALFLVDERNTPWPVIGATERMVDYECVWVSVKGHMQYKFYPNGRGERAALKLLRMPAAATPTPQAAEPVPVEAVSEDTKRLDWLERNSRDSNEIDPTCWASWQFGIDRLRDAIDAAIAASPSSAGGA